MDWVRNNVDFLSKAARHVQRAFVFGHRNGLIAIHLIQSSTPLALYSATKLGYFIAHLLTNLPTVRRNLPAAKASSYGVRRRRQAITTAVRLDPLQGQYKLRGAAYRRVEAAACRHNRLVERNAYWAGLE